MSMVEASREALEEKVNVGEKALNAALSKLAESLGSYGFQGRITLKLRVGIRNKSFHVDDDTVVERSTEFNFQR